MASRQMSHCSHCDREIPAGIVWCIHCGERAQPRPERTQGQCQHCNAINSHDIKFCQSCGSALNNESSSTGAYAQQDGVNINQGSNDTTISSSEHGGDTTRYIAMGNWSIVPLVGSILGVLVLVFGVLGAEGAPQEAAAAAIGVGLAAIPYVFARAISELQARNT